ncbi:MAG: Gx transporter family protein [Oscillospiraceae bacterium]|nr:Gx transporter family protein [Oscillospiraceae bacterium]
MRNTKQLALYAVLIALALALSYTERLIPLQLLIPLPGVKLGLANIVTLITLYLLGTKHAFWVLIPRCILGAIFGGGITGLLFSLFGGTLALMTMTVSKKCPLFSIYGVSLLGAAAHNVGQMISAMLVMRSIYVGAYLPYLLMVSLFTGFAIGGACAGVLRTLRSVSISPIPEIYR